MPWPSRCSSCRTKVAAYLFNSVIRVEQAPQAAMPDDVTCAFHPNKKAEEICAGTGSYICSLCAITLGDKTYSAEFINQGGLKNIGESDAFERKLARPDTVVWSCLLLMILTVWTLVGPVILFTVGCVYFVKHVRLRRENKLYARVTSATTTALMATGLGLVLLIGLIMLATIFLI